MGCIVKRPYRPGLGLVLSALFGLSHIAAARLLAGEVCNCRNQKVSSGPLSEMDKFDETRKAKRAPWARNRALSREAIKSTDFNLFDCFCHENTMGVPPLD